MFVIRRDATGELLCGSNTTLPRWGTTTGAGELVRFSALLVFPSRDAAHEYADDCSLTRDEDVTFVPLLLGEVT